MKEGIIMANERTYTKEDYIKFTAELLQLLPEGFVKKIYSIVAIERRRDYEREKEQCPKS